jgi:hypothetical protein
MKAWSGNSIQNKEAQNGKTNQDRSGQARHARDIAFSRIGIGFEKLDRNVFDRRKPMIRSPRWA